MFVPLKRHSCGYPTYQASHNHYSPLFTHMSAALRATLGNVRIVEIDMDDVPWKDALVTHAPEIINGYMAIPKGPGWGTAVNEEVARAHAWNSRKTGNVKGLPPAKSY